MRAIFRLGLSQGAISALNWGSEFTFSPNGYPVVLLPCIKNAFELSECVFQNPLYM